MIKRKQAYLFCTTVFLFSLLLFRLFFLSRSSAVSQVLDGQYTRSIPLAERDGFILDRNGVPMNYSHDGYLCLVDPARLENIYDASEEIAHASGSLQSQTVERILGGVPFSVHCTQTVEKKGAYSYRSFKRGVLLAPHLIGYRDISGEAKSGIERAYNGFLTGLCRGTLSYRYSADARGVPLSDSGTVMLDKGFSAVSGVVTTLDAGLQSEAEKIAGEHIEKGALCISEIDSGRLLASVSLPDFDTENVAKYLDSKNGELTNRCAMGFTPGSVFKIIVCAAALEYDASLYGEEYTCLGSYSQEDSFSVSCHKKEGHGEMTMLDAFAHSCNPYFIQLTEKIGVGRVLEMAEKMGLGKVNSLSDVAYYGRTLPAAADTDAGFFANIAIGQGRLLVSPYEALTVYSCAASGRKTDLRLVSGLVLWGETVKEYKSEEGAVLSEDTRQLLCEMMAYCVKEGLGTTAAPKNLSAGGKTATAQTGRYDENRRELLNSWFCGVYPIDAPKYAICVLCDASGSGKSAMQAFSAVCDALYTFDPSLAPDSSE